MVKYTLNYEGKEIWNVEGELPRVGEIYVIKWEGMKNHMNLF